jgi:hypothetical protein
VLASGLYVSSFLTAAFLLGAGWIDSPGFPLLCDTLFAPLLVLDGETGRIEWLFNVAGDAYWLGFSANQ